MCDYTKKNYIIIGLIFVILLGIMLFYERPVEDELPLLVRVDGILYQYYDDVQEQPTEDANGYIVGTVSGICIWLNDNLWLLKPIQ